MRVGLPVPAVATSFLALAGKATESATIAGTRYSSLGWTCRIGTKIKIGRRFGARPICSSYCVTGIVARKAASFGKIHWNSKHSCTDIGSRCVSPCNESRDIETKQAPICSTPAWQPPTGWTYRIRSITGSESRVAGTGSGSSGQGNGERGRRHYYGLMADIRVH